MRTKTVRATIWPLLILLSYPSECDAQEETQASVHWAYSAYFGTGWYSVSNDRDVFIFRVTPEWRLTDASIDDSGNRTIGWYVKTPVLAGLDRFDVDDVIDAVDLDNVAFLSVNPTIDVEIPVNRVWWLRPYASVGYGTALDGSESALSYWAGIKSRVTLHSGPRVNWYLLNMAGFVGYTPDEGPSDSFWPLMTGLEMNHPVGETTADGSRWLIHWNAKYTAFGGDVFFSTAPTAKQAIEDQWEVGDAIGKSGAPIKIWFVNFDRLGLGYRSSSNGELQGITSLTIIRDGPRFLRSEDEHTYHQRTQQALSSVHIGRAVGGHRHYWSADRPSAPSGQSGPRRGAAG